MPSEGQFSAREFHWVVCSRPSFNGWLTQGTHIPYKFDLIIIDVTVGETIVLTVTKWMHETKKGGCLNAQILKPLIPQIDCCD